MWSPAVGLGGRNLDVADPRDAGELEENVRAVDVRDDEAARREAGRVEVRLGGEVDDRLAAVRGSGGGDRVRHVALDELMRGAFEPREAPEIRQPVEHDGLVAGRHEALDEVATEKAGAAWHEDSHAATLAHQETRAFDVAGERPAAFEAPCERVGDSPAAHTLAVEAEPVAVEVEAATDPPGGVRIARKVVSPVPE